MHYYPIKIYVSFQLYCPAGEEKNIQNEVVKNNKLRFCFILILHFYALHWANRKQARNPLIVIETVKTNAPLANKHLSLHNK